MVVIVLTCLNDFTVVSIAFDHVQISNDPNSWWLARNIMLGSIIGANTLCWSIAAFLVMLDSMDPASPWCKKYGICMDYTQVLTGAFLQLSLSARLARTNARKMATWFWTSALKRAVIATMSFSVSMAMIFAFTWPFCPGSGLWGWASSGSACDPHMSPIHVLFGGVIILYQIPIHLFRDLCYNTLFKYFMNSDYAAYEKTLPKKRELDDRCAKVMRELGLDVKEAKGIEEKLPVSMITEEDLGGCLPCLGDSSGPPLFIMDGCSKTMRCNPLGFFLLYFAVGAFACIIWYSGDRNEKGD